MNTSTAPSAVAATAGAAIPKATFDWKPVALLVAIALAGLPLIGSPSTWVTLTVAGLAMGMIVFIIASGLTLVFGLMDVLNFGHGVFIALGAYVAMSTMLALDAWVGSDLLLLNALAVLYHTQSKYAQAEPLYQRVLTLLEQTIGPDHPTLATTLNNLAVVYEAQDKYAEAAPLYQRALALIERTLGPDHPNLAVALDNYADLLRKMQREAEAESAEARAKAIWAKQKEAPAGK